MLVGTVLARSGTAAEATTAKGVEGQMAEVAAMEAVRSQGGVRGEVVLTASEAMVEGDEAAKQELVPARLVGARMVGARGAIAGTVVNSQGGMDPPC